MIWIIILLTYVYWIFESQSEAYTWMASWNSSKPINPRAYHIIRIPETLSIIISHLILGYLLLGWYGAPMVVLAEITGCILYERFYCAKNYRDFFYQKTSLWLGLKHPPVWLEVVLFTICFILLVILGV